MIFDNRNLLSTPKNNSVNNSKLDNSVSQKWEAPEI